MYECDVWDFPEPFSRLRWRRGWLQRLEFYNQALSRHRLIFGNRLHGLEHVQTPEDLYRSFGQGKSAAIWGEKSPVYCTRLHHLARRYPGCAFIVLWRDPVEIYRSIVHAGRKARFFRRPGFLNWLIYSHEKMVQQTTRLSRAGIRIHHVTYDSIVDETEAVCRNLCRFLNIDFDPAMLDLSRADFSAVYQAPQHDHLRRGLIERQCLSGEVLTAPVIRKLQRFHSRWSRLQNHSPHALNGSPTGPEPGWTERQYHKVAGSVFYFGYNVKRALFEFLPLPWLRTYRLMKKWFRGRQTSTSTGRPSLLRDWSNHWFTILASGLFLAGVAAVDMATGPQVSLAPFYLIPCAATALVVGRRWATLTALCSAILFTWGRTQGAEPSSEPGLLIWNTAMRFVLFQVIVVLLDRIRVEINSTVNPTSGDLP